MTAFPTLTTTDPKGIQAWSAQLVRVLERSIPDIGLGLVTLDTNAEETTVSDQIAAAGGGVFLTPASQAAASMMIPPHVPPETIGEGSFIIQHTSEPSDDRTFRYLIVGPDSDPADQ